MKLNLMAIWKLFTFFIHASIQGWVGMLWGMGLYSWGCAMGHVGVGRGGWGGGGGVVGVGRVGAAIFCICMEFATLHRKSWFKVKV